MLELLIESLIEKPTRLTAPLFLAINKPAVLATQGLTAGRGVMLSDQRKLDGQEIEMPYVRMYDDGQKRTLDKAMFINGGEIENEARLLVVECAANGETKLEAAFRAEKLRLVVMVLLRNLIDEIEEDLVITDDSGSASTYRIDKWNVSPGDDPHVKGPGNEESDLYTSLKYIDVEVWTTLSIVP